MVHGARRESLGRWNEISYRGIFGSISNSRKRNSKAREKLRCAESAIPRPAPIHIGVLDGSQPRVTFEDTLLADDRTSCRACITVPASALTYGSHWRGYSRWAPLLLHLRAPGRNFPPTWSNLIRTCANNQCAPPSTRQPFCVCVQRAHAPSRRHLRPAGGRFFSVSRADRESPRDRSE